MIEHYINGAFEMAGAFFIWLSINMVLRDKVVRGVSWVHLAFFAAWGFWNLWYYPAVGDWVSFMGGVAILTANVIYMVLLVYYTRYPGGRAAAC